MGQPAKVWPAVGFLVDRLCTMTLPDADTPFLLKALDHYADFLRATSRDDRPYREILARLEQPEAPREQPERKAPVREEPQVITAKRKRR